MNNYIHKTNNRLRVRSNFIKQNPKAVAELISELEKIDAILTIKHKLYAGSVAISFDSNEIDCESLLEIIESHHWLQQHEKNSFVENAVVNGTKTFVKGVTLMAIKQLVGPSFSRVLTIL